MQRALLITEKPSLMRDIEKVYKKMVHPIQIDFASFVGHVVELKEPHEYKAEWKKWNVELNEIYGVLKEQLSTEQMGKLGTL